MIRLVECLWLNSSSTTSTPRKRTRALADTDSDEESLPKKAQQPTPAPAPASGDTMDVEVSEERIRLFTSLLTALFREENSTIVPVQQMQQHAQERADFSPAETETILRQLTSRNRVFVKDGQIYQI